MMDEDNENGGDGIVVIVSEEAKAEKFALLKQAVKETPTDYAAHLSLVGYLRKERPQSLDLLKARQE